jgi:hypothetical protein
MEKQILILNESESCMDETIQPSAANRDWRVQCYDTTGEMRVCVIDSDRGALRVSLSIGEQEQFFELRAKQVDQFQAALAATLGRIKAGGPDKPVRWEGHCYNSWDELLCCLIEATDHDAVRISCVLPSTGGQECFLELRKEHIEEFQAALAAAMEVFHTDVATHGEHWNDDEVDETETVSPRGIEETVFVREVDRMIATDAPQMLALVEEIGDCADAITIAWCLEFPDHAEVISAGPDHIRGSFCSAERARTLLSAGDKAKIRLVSVAEAQQQVKTA